MTKHKLIKKMQENMPDDCRDFFDELHIENANKNSRASNEYKMLKNKYFLVAAGFLLFIICLSFVIIRLARSDYSSTDGSTFDSGKYIIVYADTTDDFYDNYKLESAMNLNISELLQEKMRESSDNALYCTAVKELYFDEYLNGYTENGFTYLEVLTDLDKYGNDLLHLMCKNANEKYSKDIIKFYNISEARVIEININGEGYNFIALLTEEQILQMSENGCVLWLAEYK